MHVASMPKMIYHVKALSNVLTDPQYCYFPRKNVTTVTEKATNRHAIRVNAEDLLQKNIASSTVLIHFPGHSIQGDQGRAFLCPYETDLDALEDTTIAGDEFSQRLSAIPAQKMVACHSSGAAIPRAPNTKHTWRSTLPATYIESLARGNGTVVINSSRESQSSWNWKDGSHDVFTWHLLEELKGAAGQADTDYIFVFNLFDYIQQYVQEEI